MGSCSDWYGGARNCQWFKVKPGDNLQWMSSSGDAGEVVADQWGLVAVQKLVIRSQAKITVTLSAVPRK